MPPSDSGCWALVGRPWAGERCWPERGAAGRSPALGACVAIAAGPRGGRKLGDCASARRVWKHG